MDYEQNNLMISEYIKDPVWVAWCKQNKESRFPYHLVQYHLKWSILKPVIEYINENVGSNYWALPVRKLLSHSIADKIDAVYSDLVDAVEFLNYRSTVESK
jgi:hypothetical protein